MDIDIESLELATLDAVAPAQVGTHAGWLLPFDNTTIGRAISAVPVRHDAIDPSQIPDIEARYAERGLKTQFRIADVAGLSDLHTALSRHGYTAQQATWTLVGKVQDWPAAPSRTVHLGTQPSQPWESVYLSEDFDPVDGANRVRALSRSDCLVYGWLADADAAVCAGTAAFSRNWVSLHGLRTLAKARGKGCASDLIAALGQEARKRNIARCFLQVEAENASAIRLYRSVGFQTAWLYHYWRKPA